MPGDVVEVFLAGAGVVVDAIRDDAVGDGWDRPSVLEEQRVSAIAGHLARGGVWVVGDYLDNGTPDRPVDVDSAVDYFAAFVDTASPEAHRAIRERGQAVASVGRLELVRTLEARLADLGPALRRLQTGHPVEVIGGRIMRIEDYLVTRVVEQTVHLDDLARSVDAGPWPLPPEAEALTIAVGAEIARRRSGAGAVIRALYRRGFADAAFPVL